MERKPYTTKEVAKELGISTIYATKLCQSGRLKASKHNDSWIIYPPDFRTFRRAFLKAREARARRALEKQQQSPKQVTEQPQEGTQSQ
jgi:Helix-turn-helix domain